MKEIALHGKYGDGKSALVSDEDFDRTKQYSWTLTKSGYVTRSYKSETKWIRQEMQRFILDVYDSNVFVDHINHNPLDNSRENIRLSDRRGNARNQRKVTHVRGNKPSSQFKGVSWNKERNRWAVRCYATIAVDGKEISKNILIGYFRDELEAAAAYDTAAIQYHGEFAYTNFPTSKE